MLDNKGSPKLLLALIVAASIAHTTVAHAGEPPILNTADARCAIDEAMEKRAEVLIKQETAFVEKAVGKPGRDAVAEADGAASCIPDFGGSIFGKFPSFGSSGFSISGIISGLFDDLLDFASNWACNAANEFLSDLVNGFDFSYGDPYGIINIGISGNTDGEFGTGHETYDISKVVKGPVLGKWDAAKKHGTEVIKDMPVNPPRLETEFGRQPKHENASGVTEKIKEWDLW